MILFIEYVIPETNRDAFLAWARKHRELWREAEWMENTGQPGVFVELWRTAGEDVSLRMQRERLDGRSPWRDMDGWIKGGREGVRMWTFSAVIPDE